MIETIAGVSLVATTVISAGLALREAKKRERVQDNYELASRMIVQMRAQILSYAMAEDARRAQRIAASHAAAAKRRASKEIAQ